MARKYSMALWAACVVAVAAVLAVAYLYRGTLPSGSGGPAFVNCSNSIRSAVSNPSAAVIPYIPNRGTRGDGYYAWTHGSGLRLQNEFGALIDSTASCTTDINGTITSLSVNGESIL